MKINAYHPFRSPQAKEQFLSTYDAHAQQWPVPSETRTIETSYGQTFVRISGPAVGTSLPSAMVSPIILLHGHLENSLNWSSNIEDLSQFYRTYAIDTISDPGRSIYTKLIKSSDDYTNWLDQVFDGLGLDQGINLIGFSYGGWLVSQYALRFPQRLDKIVMMAPVGIAPLSLRFLIFARFLNLFKFRIQFLFKLMMRWTFNDFLEVHENSEEKFNEWFNFLYLGIRSYQPPPMIFANNLTDEDIKQLKMPTLLLLGENEIIYSVKKVITRIQNVAPSLQIKVIQNAGHDLPKAQPKTVNQAILDFLKGRNSR